MPRTRADCMLGSARIRQSAPARMCGPFQHQSNAVQYGTVQRTRPIFRGSADRWAFVLPLAGGDAFRMSTVGMASPAPHLDARCVRVGRADRGVGVMKDPVRLAASRTRRAADWLWAVSGGSSRRHSAMHRRGTREETALKRSGGAEALCPVPSPCRCASASGWYERDLT